MTVEGVYCGAEGELWTVRPADAGAGGRFASFISLLKGISEISEIDPNRPPRVDGIRRVLMGFSDSHSLNALKAKYREGV